MTGYDSKRQMAADKLQEPVREALKLALEALEEYADHEGKTRAADEAITAIQAALAQPAQEPQYEYLVDDLAEWKQYVEVDNAPYGLREHVTKVLLAHGIKERNHGT